jgi:uncharacterized protein
MNAELSTLYQVQQLDIEIVRRRQALAALDTGAALEAEICALQAELADLAKKREAAENDNLDTELEMKSLQEKRDRFQKQLYSGAVSNPRQLSDLQNEVQMLEREIRKVEDRDLELMETLETLRGEIAAREARQRELQGQLVEVKAAYADAGARLKTELAALEASRAETAQGLTGSLLKRYDQIRVRSANLGLVKIIGKDCPGCHVSLPSDTLKALKSGRGLQSCESCGRILYREEAAAVSEE